LPGSLEKVNHDPSSSVIEFRKIIDRPVCYPAWFFAAYPDVVKWMCDISEASLKNSNDYTEQIFAEIEQCLPEGKYDPSESAKFNINYLRVIIDTYKSKIKKKLECC